MSNPPSSWDQSLVSSQLQGEKSFFRPLAPTPPSPSTSKYPVTQYTRARRLLERCLRSLHPAWLVSFYEFPFRRMYISPGYQLPPLITSYHNYLQNTQIHVKSIFWIAGVHKPPGLPKPHLLAIHFRNGPHSSQHLLYHIYLPSLPLPMLACYS